MNKKEKQAYVACPYMLFYNYQRRDSNPHLPLQDALPLSY